MEKSVFEFLKVLEKNNHRDWFAEHKNRYAQARALVVAFTEKLLQEMANFDAEMHKVDAEKSLYRIYRDTRFSADKSPYKTHFGVRLGNGKKHFEARYYLHIQPNACFVAGGIYMPEKDRLKAIREKISAEADTFQELISEKSFQKYFKDFRQDEKLKRVPADFDKNDPMAEYLKLKDFVAICPISDTMLLEKDAPEKLAQIYQSLKPINDFLSDVS